MRLPCACRNDILGFSDICRKQVSRSFSGACRGRVFPDVCSVSLRRLKNNFLRLQERMLASTRFPAEVRAGCRVFRGVVRRNRIGALRVFPRGVAVFPLLFSARRGYLVWRQTFPAAEYTELLLCDCGEKTAGVRPAYSDRHILSKNKTR